MTVVNDELEIFDNPAGKRYWIPGWIIHGDRCISPEGEMFTTTGTRGRWHHVDSFGFHVEGSGFFKSLRAAYLKICPGGENAPREVGFVAHKKPAKKLKDGAEMMSLRLSKVNVDMIRRFKSEAREQAREKKLPLNSTTYSDIVNSLIDFARANLYAGEENEESNNQKQGEADVPEP